MRKTGNFQCKTSNFSSFCHPTQHPDVSGTGQVSASKQGRYRFAGFRFFFLKTVFRFFFAVLALLLRQRFARLAAGAVFFIGLQKVYIKIVVVVNAGISVDKSVFFFEISCLAQK